MVEVVMFMFSKPTILSFLCRKTKLITPTLNIKTEIADDRFGISEEAQKMTEEFYSNES